MPAKAFVREAGDGVDDETERAGQGHGELIPEAQGPGSLALPYVGLVDALKERRADGTAWLARSILSRRSLICRARSQPAAAGARFCARCPGQRVC